MTDHGRRRAAVEITVERLNAECAAAGMPQGYRVGVNVDDVPYVALADSDAVVERVRLDPPTIKRERL